MTHLSSRCYRVVPDVQGVPTAACFVRTLSVFSLLNFVRGRTVAVTVPSSEKDPVPFQTWSAIGEGNNRCYNTNNTFLELLDYSLSSQVTALVSHPADSIDLCFHYSFSLSLRRVMGEFSTLSDFTDQALFAF